MSKEYFQLIDFATSIVVNPEEYDLYLYNLDKWIDNRLYELQYEPIPKEKKIHIMLSNDN